MPEEFDYGGDYYGGSAGDASLDAAIMQDAEEEKEAALIEAAAQSEANVVKPLLTRGEALRFAADLLAKQNFYASWIPVDRLLQAALEEDGKIGKCGGELLAKENFTIGWTEVRDHRCCMCGCNWQFPGLVYSGIRVAVEPDALCTFNITLKDLLSILLGRIEQKDAIIKKLTDGETVLGAVDLLDREVLLKQLKEKDILNRSLQEHIKTELEGRNDFSNL